MDKKYCPKCKREREKFLFHKSPKRKDGLDGYCAECVSFIHKLIYRRHKKDNPDFGNEKAREHYWKNRDKVLLRGREWHKKNNILVAEKARTKRQQYKKNFDSFLDYSYFGMENRIKYKAKYKYRKLELCSKEEFLKFALDDKNLKGMFDKWVLSGNSFWLKPTVDRIDNMRGYAIDNIQFLTHRDNTHKGRAEYKEMLLGYKKYIYGF